MTKRQTTRKKSTPEKQVPEKIDGQFDIKKSATRLYKAAGYSLAGLSASYRHERAFREEVWLLILLIPIAFLLGNSHVEYLLLIGSWVLVMITELLNTAIEAAIDRIDTGYHELSKLAKDTGSAAVMVSLILAICTWVLIAVN